MTFTSITDLPEECISHILSLTSPIDAVRSSTVSKQFLTASESDIVWNKFLPSNLDEIVAHSSTPHFFQQFTSKKQQSLYLCSSHLLLYNETWSFALSRWSGKKCYMFGARALYIERIKKPRYWTKKSLLESRFPEIAALKGICWLLIEAKIDPITLSKNTTYGTYFVYKMEIINHGFDSTPVKAYVYETITEDVFEYIIPRDFNVDDVPFKNLHFKAASGTRPLGELPYARDDGWMEIEMGRYYVRDFVDEYVTLKMRLEEVERFHWKSGLIIQGIELRPLD